MRELGSSKYNIEPAVAPAATGMGGNRFVPSLGFVMVTVPSAEVALTCRTSFHTFTLVGTLLVNATMPWMARKEAKSVSNCAGNWLGRFGNLERKTSVFWTVTRLFCNIY